MIKNTMRARAALAGLCVFLSACAVPGMGQKTLGDQASSFKMGADRSRPEATSAVAGADGKVRLLGELKPAPPPPIIAELPTPAGPSSRPPANLTAPVAARILAAPTATPSPPVVAEIAPQVAPESQRQEIVGEILAWRKAWAEGDVASYISHYVRSFHGDLPSRKAWEIQRRERLSNPDISVRIADLTVRLIDGRALAEFEQRYTSKKHEDVGTKRMKLRKIDGRWLITEESWSKN